MATKLFKTLFPFLLGGGILYWMYRQFPFSEVEDLLLHQMKWGWMLLSFIPGILAQVFRGLRWNLTLVPLGETPRKATSIYSIFLSYAASLFIPRVGEVMRCGVLARYDGVSFSKSLGTVLTERMVDTVLMLVLVVVAFSMQYKVFADFFDITGMDFSRMFDRVTGAGIFVTLLCLACMAAFLLLLWRKLKMAGKVRNILEGIKEGILSLGKVKDMGRYLTYSVGIWVAYFLHYYLTFFCFDFTEDLGVMAALASFCVGTIAVIVPTPNGAGPWHFAVKTILVIYGLTEIKAASFVLVVHSIQTLLLVGLGIVAMTGLKTMKTINQKQ